MGGVVIGSDERSSREVIQRRTLAVLMVAQVFSGAGLAAGVTVGALIAKDMLGSTGLAGLPAALFTGGSAGAALVVGRLSDAAGRRVGLSAGYLTGALGGATVVVAALIDNVALLLVSLTLYGAGTATNLQARYAGADLAHPSRRGRAISQVLVATTLGAVAGPKLVPVMGDLAAGWGIPRLAGPFMLAAVAYGLAALVLATCLRPDPLLVARQLLADEAPPATQSPRNVGSDVAPTIDLDARRTILFAGAGLVLSQAVMVGVMTMTPVHLGDHGHGLGAVGTVIAVHIAAMYLPSPIAGALVDRVGRRPVMAAGGIMLVAAGLVAARAPEDSVAFLTLALGLLGLGWNLTLVGATALIADAATGYAAGRTQGAVDVSVALAGAAGGLSSGPVMAAAGYPFLGLAGAVLALMILPIVLKAGRPCIPQVRRLPA